MQAHNSKHADAHELRARIATQSCTCCLLFFCFFFFELKTQDLRKMLFQRGILRGKKGAKRVEKNY